MRGRGVSVLILFHTTTEAMAMEAACGRDGLPGRLIPIPSFVSAGCGFGWKAPEEKRELLLNYMRENGLSYEREGVYEL